MTEFRKPILFQGFLMQRGTFYYSKRRIGRKLNRHEEYENECV